MSYDSEGPLNQNVLDPGSTPYYSPSQRRLSSMKHVPSEDASFSFIPESMRPTTIARIALIAGLLLGSPLWAGRSFNGSSAVISVTSGGTIDLYGLPDITLSCWVYVTVVPSTEVDPCGKGNNLNGTESYYINLSQSGNAGLFGAHFFQTTPENHNVDFFCTSVTVQANTWYNVVATFNSNFEYSVFSQIYVNGVECGQATNANGNLTEPGVGDPNWCFGAYATTGTPGLCTNINFSGIVAESALWNVALSPAEAEGLATVCPGRVRSTAIVAYWPLWGASGSAIEPDLSGNNNNGTLTGATTANHPPCAP